MALSLRASLVAISPLLDQIVGESALSEGQAGLLITLPLLCFGLLSPFIPSFAQRYGMDAVLTGAMAVLAVGILIRIFEPTFLLFAGTVVLGVGIAAANVVMPGLIKRDHGRRLGAMTGIYTASISVGATLGAALSIPIQRISGWDWRQVLAIWAVPALLTVVPLARRMRLPSNPGTQPIKETLPIASLDLYRDRLAWSVSVFVGMQSLIYFGAIAWLPSILTSAGLGAKDAGLYLAIFNLIGLPLTFLVPVLAARRHSQFNVMTVTNLLNAIGVLGLILLPASGTLVWIVALGLGQASSFGLAFALIGIRAPGSRYATELSGMAQTIGYCLAATGPVMMGIVFDLTGKWNFAFGTLIVAVVVLQISGATAARPPSSATRPTGATG